MNIRYLALAVLFAVALQTVGYSQEKKPWWNPFASGESSGSTTKSRDSDYFGGSKKVMPEFKLPTWSKSSSKSKSQPSTMSKISSTSKRWWDNTVDFMNPFDSKTTTKSNGYQPQAKQVSKGKGMFGWMWQEEKTESPSSVKEFLRSPRPGFDDNYTR